MFSKLQFVKHIIIYLYLSIPNLGILFPFFQDYMVKKEETI